MGIRAKISKQCLRLVLEPKTSPGFPPYQAIQGTISDRGGEIGKKTTQFSDDQVMKLLEIVCHLLNCRKKERNNIQT